MYFGNVYNEGNISMTARGTYNCAGQNVYLWKNIDNSYEFVPAVRRKTEVQQHIIEVQVRQMQILKFMEILEE